MTRLPRMTPTSIVEARGDTGRSSAVPDEAYASDQVESQGVAVVVDHRRLGPVTLPGPPLRFFDRDAGEGTRTSHTAPPVLDADGEAIRAWLAQEH